MSEHVCERCGSVIPGLNYESFYWLDGYYCEDCVEDLQSDGLIDFCPECGEFVDPDELVWVEGYERYGGFVCSDCVERVERIHRCRECGSYFDGRYVSIYATGYTDEYVCQQCFCDQDYGECQDCGDVFRLEDLEYVSHEDSYYCESCMVDHRKEKKIHEYGYKPTPKFKCSAHDEFPGPYDPDSPLMFGVELEIDGDGDDDDQNDAADAICDASEDVYLKADGSLSDCGIEIVTEPCTLDYHLNELGWDRICDAALEYEYRSHDTDTCGMHVHVGRRQLGYTSQDRTRTIANLLLLLSIFEPEVVKFTRRKRGNLDHWSKMPDYAVYSSEEVVMRNAEGRGGSRYKALNLNNSSTIEFRIFRGTLKVSTIKATLEFVHNIVMFAKNKTFEECRNASWLEVALYSNEWDELPEYLEERGLMKDRKPIGGIGPADVPAEPDANHYWTRAEVEAILATRTSEPIARCVSRETLSPGSIVSNALYETPAVFIGNDDSGAMICSPDYGVHSLNGRCEDGLGFWITIIDEYDLYGRIE